MVAWIDSFYCPFSVLFSYFCVIDSVLQLLSVLVLYVVVSVCVGFLFLLWGFLGCWCTLSDWDDQVHWVD